MPIKLETHSPLVITFRSHHNAYQNGDGSGAKIIHYKEPDSALYRGLQILWGMFILHYFLWFIPMFLMVWLPFSWGYPLISLILLGLYIPTYFNKDELNYGRTWEWLRTNNIWKCMQHYGQLEIVREVELDEKRQYIFGYHPHGILILSRIGTYGGIFEIMFPGIEARCLGATPMFNHPGSREICLWMGAVRADRSTAEKILSTDKLSLFLYPGGSEEIFLTDPKSKVNTIIGRKGFIKLALQKGCDLVPAFVFGEKHAYNKLDIPSFIKSFFMKKLRMPLIIFWGRFLSWLPVKKENAFLSVVYGVPIRIEKAVEDPSDDEIDELYEKFYGEVRNIFDKYKKRYGYDDDETLVIKEAIKSTKAQGKSNYTNTKAVIKNGTVSNGYSNGQNGH